jgi:hypothetical protein
MKQMAPPPVPPRVALDDDGGMRRLRFRLWQLLMTFLTVLITAWFCTLGAVPAIAALMIAKHVLVAILVLGLGVDQHTEVCPGPP